MKARKRGSSPQGSLGSKGGEAVKFNAVLQTCVEVGFGDTSLLVFGTDPTCVSREVERHGRMESVDLRSNWHRSMFNALIGP
jgi:hypothetical protein